MDFNAKIIILILILVFIKFFILDVDHFAVGTQKTPNKICIPDYKYVGNPKKKCEKMKKGTICAPSCNPGEKLIYGNHGYGDGCYVRTGQKCPVTKGKK